MGLWPKSVDALPSLSEGGYSPMTAGTIKDGISLRKRGQPMAPASRSSPLSGIPRPRKASTVRCR